MAFCIILGSGGGIDYDAITPDVANWTLIYKSKNVKNKLIDNNGDVAEGKLEQYTKDIVCSSGLPYEASGIISYTWASSENKPYILDIDENNKKRLFIKVHPGYFSGKNSYVGYNANILGNARPEDVVNNYTFSSEKGLGIKGNMTNNPTVTSANSVSYNNGNLYIRIKTGAYLYEYSNKQPQINVPVSLLNLDRSSIASDRSILGITGTIPVVNGDSNYKSIATRNSMSLFTNHPDKHRRIIIPVNKSLYRCDYVAGICDDLRPENIRLGKTIAGVKGTMKDYSSGRIQF